MTLFTTNLYNREQQHYVKNANGIKNSFGQIVLERETVLNLSQHSGSELRCLSYARLLPNILPVVVGSAEAYW